MERELTLGEALAAFRAQCRLLGAAMRQPFWPLFRPFIGERRKKQRGNRK